MKASEYQVATRTTMNYSITHSERLSMLCMGLSGESGELIDHVKKYLYHGHDLEVNYAEKELGDVMWYVANLCNDLQLDLGHVLQLNLEKLKKRYPDGFSEQASREREE